jgi:hypothetical protein
VTDSSVSAVARRAALQLRRRPNPTKATVTASASHPQVTADPTAKEPTTARISLDLVRREATLEELCPNYQCVTGPASAYRDDTDDGLVRMTR